MEEAEGKRGPQLTGQVSYYTVADLTFALRSSWLHSSEPLSFAASQP